MQFKFTKNIQFTKLIKVNGRLKEFNFRKPNGKQEGLFTVDVIDENARRIIFSMEKKDNIWKITNTQLPAWVIDKEDSFNEIIEEEFKIS